MTITASQVKEIRQEFAKLKPAAVTLDGNRAMTVKQATFTFAPTLERMKKRGFDTQEIVEKLHEKGIVVTADVFGTIIGNDVDIERVGQDYTALAGTVDVLSPMVYPSHYGTGVYGYRVPDAEPYGTVLAALNDSAEELLALEEADRAIVRPWLQAFTATWVDGHISYGGEQIRQQIQAVYDAGYEEWILWNSRNHYSSDGLLFADEADTDSGPESPDTENTD